MSTNNLILHSISNRRGPYESGIFPTSYTYNPKDLSADIEGILETLGLSHTSSDDTLYAILSAIELHPRYKSKIAEEFTTYDISNFPVRDLGDIFNTIVEKVAHKKEMLNMIMSISCLDSFTSSSNPVEKTAIIGVALAYRIIHD